MSRKSPLAAVSASLRVTYEYLVYERPWLVLLLLVALLMAGGWYSRDFELDASGESLVLDNDPDLQYYRDTREAYGTDEYLVVTWTPREDLLSDSSLQALTEMRDRFLALDSVARVNSILDVPILYHSGLGLSELGDGLKTLGSGQVARELARREFHDNPFYNRQLVSNDGHTTALQVIFHFDEVYYDLINHRNALPSRAGNLSDAETNRFERLQDDIAAHNSMMLERRAGDIAEVRAIMDDYRPAGRLYLGGLPMIATDMIRFIRHDLEVFGVGVLLFLVVILTLFFGRLRWILMPLACCSVTAVLMLGFLGLSGWRVTVISSNFLSILLIITLSLCIHLIVRFRDLQLERQDLTHQSLIRETVASMAKPCFFTIFTTIVAFGSLISSHIRPVIDFGWIMVIGLTFAYVISFLLFPASLSIARAAPLPPHHDLTRRFTLAIAGLVRRHAMPVLLLSLILTLGVGAGISQLRVENRFIDNFSDETEIYQGMTVIDRELGGTTPLEVIIEPDQDFLAGNSTGTGSAELDELFAEFSEEAGPPSYWLNPVMMDRAARLQHYLEQIPVTGKVLSISTVVDIATHLNGSELDAFELALIHRRVPEEFAGDLVRPYLSDDGNQIRYSVRVMESDHSLNRKDLLDRLNSFMTDEMDMAPDQFHLTGMLVLYNNMLQSLFESQILTLGSVALAIFITFLFIFQDARLAAIGMLPNIFSAVLILGIMGWIGIPLDMMTITIASITIGISVDDTIHYIHRVREEYRQNQDYPELVTRCHGSIGKAMFYTSFAIVFGFAILALSDFTPTINFGLMTGIAMVVALAGDLLMLPALFLVLRPRLQPD